ncbi:MAG: hypothetical protein AB9880_08890 [Christensenellales bacterium]
MKKTAWSLLFWGGVWGILEASLGQVLHLAAVALPGLPGAVMFPLAFFCMRRAYGAGGGSRAPLQIAGISAAIKLVDLLVPGHDALRVINPALSILLEGLAVTALLALPRLQGNRPGLLHTLGMGVLWRGLFSGWLLLISRFGLPAGLVTSGLPTFLRFFLLESALNALLIQAGLYLGSRLAGRAARRLALPPERATAALGGGRRRAWSWPERKMVRPAAAWCVCALALALQALL